MFEILDPPQVFGESLDALVARSGLYGVPAVVQDCLDWLEARAMDSIGVWQVSGAQGTNGVAVDEAGCAQAAQGGLRSCRN